MFWVMEMCMNAMHIVDTNVSSSICQIASLNAAAGHLYVMFEAMFELEAVGVGWHFYFGVAKRHT